jgi:DNA-binding IscR family transcriptional regulator
MRRHWHQLSITGSRPAAQISLADVIAYLDGTPEQPDHAQGSNELQVIRALGEELRLRRDQLLTSTTLSDLLTERDARLQAQAMYFI